MAEPPTYEESTSAYGYRGDSESKSKVSRLSIREEVSASRSQHVVALVSRLLPQIRARAQRGLSKTTLVLLPSNQEHGSKGELVGFPGGDIPTIIQLEGNVDTLEFWTQEGAVEQLQSQMLAAVSDERPPLLDEPPLPPKTTSPNPSRFGRKQAKPQKQPPSHATRCPSAKVNAELDEAYFRAENAFGLFDTHRARCVVLIVEV